MYNIQINYDLVKQFTILSVKNKINRKIETNKQIYKKIYKLLLKQY